MLAQHLYNNALIISNRVSNCAARWCSNSQNKAFLRQNNAIRHSIYTLYVALSGNESLLDMLGTTPSFS